MGVKLDNMELLDKDKTDVDYTLRLRYRDTPSRDLWPHATLLADDSRRHFPLPRIPKASTIQRHKHDQGEIKKNMPSFTSSFAYAK